MLVYHCRNVYIVSYLLQQIGQLPHLLAQEHLTEDNVNECRQALFEMLRLEEQNMIGVYSVQKGKKKYSLCLYLYF